MSNLWQMQSLLISGSIAASSLLVVPFSAYSQMTPDTTLPNNSEVNTSNNTSTISGGTRVGDNLYHSLREFSVGTGDTASFDNAADIQNIFTRVTGSNVSNIDGLIRANGGANLFLINPNGIIFGQNARLNIGGSFIGSTASSIDFADGNNFPTQPQQTQPLLSVNVPIGLQFGSAPGSIQVKGLGSPVVAGSNATPIDTSLRSEGLSVGSGRTLALIGGDLNLKGSTLAAPSGWIELGSVDSGFVSLAPADQHNWSFGYEGISGLRNIDLSDRSFVDTSGSGFGAIALRGANIALRDSSLALIQNQGDTPSGSINVNATESFTLSGISPDGTGFSSLRTETTSVSELGRGADIAISTPELMLRDAARITANTYGSAPSGRITVDAPRSIQLLESNTARSFSAINSNTFGTGNAGAVDLSTTELRLLDGGTVSSGTFGAGAAGNLTVNAETTEILGAKRIETRPDQPEQSKISSASLNSGNAGAVNLKTARLRLADGGSINTSSFTTGNAGSIAIKASESVDAGGADNVFLSAIESTVQPALSPATQNTLGLPVPVSGRAGNVTIDTPFLNLSQGGEISVRSDGVGDGGTLDINASQINLSDESSISATTASGNGGNINLNSGQLALRSSEITATAGNNGNGGNIKIDTNNLIGTSDSRIVADAQQGTGGNININTQGFFFPRQNISASSQLGINGNIQIQTLNEQIVGELVELPQQPVDASQQIVSCPPEAGPQASSFTITGKGGIPEDPYRPLKSDAVWSDESWLLDDNPPFESPKRQISPSQEPRPNQSQPSQPKERQRAGAIKPLVEANSWAFNDKGEVMLLSTVGSSPKLPPPQCQSNSLLTSHNSQFKR